MVDKGKVSPEESDMFTFTSHQRALQAIAQDKLRSETTLVEVTGKGDSRVVFDKDEVSVTETETTANTISESRFSTIGCYRSSKSASATSVLFFLPRV